MVLVKDIAVTVIMFSAQPLQKLRSLVSYCWNPPYLKRCHPPKLVLPLCLKMHTSSSCLTAVWTWPNSAPALPSTPSAGPGCATTPPSGTSGPRPAPHRACLMKRSVTPYLQPSFYCTRFSPLGVAGTVQQEHWRLCRYGVVWYMCGQWCMALAWE